MESGYVSNFSNASFSVFIEESVNKRIYDQKYSTYGDSKAKRLRRFWDTENEQTIAKLMRDMLEHCSDTNPKANDPDNQRLYNSCIQEIEKLESQPSYFQNSIDHIDIKDDESISELKTSLEQDLNNHRFNVVIDRLHTFCIKYFRHKANEFGISSSNEKPLHSLAGELVKTLDLDSTKMSFKISRNSIQLLEQFNHIRNNKSLAHDNDILNNNEARLITDWVLSLLVYFDHFSKKDIIEDDDVEIPF